MLSKLELRQAPPRWWQATATLGTALGFVLLGALAFAAILALVPRAFASRLAAAELLVDLCTFVLFMLEASLVLLRPRPVAAATDLAPKIVALLGTWLMALLVLLPGRDYVPPAVSVVGTLLALAGDGLAIASVALLGRSFSVMPAARRLVVAGPYRWMRHPLYVAEEIAIAGLVAVHFSLPAVLLFAVQALCQWRRARNEERILAASFPAFADYRKRTPMLLPGVDPAVLWIGTISYAVAIFLGPRLLADPDSFLHVAAGTWIWTHGAVPSTDPFSATMQGAAWTAHEWLAELCFAGAFAALQWTGVVMLTALAIAAAFAALGATLRATLPARGVALLLAASFILVAPHLVARPHVLAMPMMVIWTGGLLRARAAGRAPSYALLPILTLWANLHGSFPLALALAGVFAAEAALAAPDPAARRGCVVNWGLFIAAAALASLLTPLGLAAWRFPLELQGMSYSLSLVGEWQASDFSHFQPLELWLLGLSALALGGAVRLPWLRLLLLLGFMHLALVHARFDDVLALLGPMLIAPCVRPFFDEARAPVVPTKWTVPLALAIGLCATTLGVARETTNADPRIAPVAALAALPAGVGFNDYDFGDFLIYSGVAPFVDGRLDLYGDSFMRAYMDALDAKGEALSELLAKYHVAWTMLKPDRPAVALLDRLPGWHRAYADASVVVHVRGSF